MFLFLIALFFTMLTSSHLLSLTSLLLQVFIQFSMNGSREVFSRAILKNSGIIPQIGKGLMTSVYSNSFPSLRWHYLLYWGRRWLAKQKEDKNSLLLKKKKIFLGTWSLRKKKKYTCEDDRQNKKKKKDHY